MKEKFIHPFIISSVQFENNNLIYKMEIINLKRSKIDIQILFIDFL